MNDQQLKLKKLIDDANKIVFFGGAGVSTESGIPDFRSQDGLYNQQYKYPPETIISHSFFFEHTKEFYEFYLAKLLLPENIKPNITHYYLAELEKKGKLSGVITQNIDGLHQVAGSQNVVELHGSIKRNYCLKCRKFYDGIRPLFKDGLPRCICGGLVKPDVVLYEEQLNHNDLKKAVSLLAQADLLIIGGTSLRVYPAAGLVYYYQGKNIVIINKGETEKDRLATLLIDDSLGNTFSSIKAN